MVLFESLFHGKRKVWLRSQPALAGIIVNFISVACPLLDKDIFVKNRQVRYERSIVSNGCHLVVIHYQSSICWQLMFAKHVCEYMF